MSWGLLPDTELSKDYVQNIFDVHQARDFAHCLGSIAQFLCAQNDVLRCCNICGGYLSAERVRGQVNMGTYHVCPRTRLKTPVPFPDVLDAEHA